MLHFLDFRYLKVFATILVLRYTFLNSMFQNESFDTIEVVFFACISHVDQSLVTLINH